MIKTYFFTFRVTHQKLNVKIASNRLMLVVFLLFNYVCIISFNNLQYIT